MGPRLTERNELEGKVQERGDVRFFLPYNINQLSFGSDAYRAEPLL